MSLPPALQAYRVAMSVLAPLAPAVLAFRARAGREDPGRLAERLGRPGPDDPRPGGPLVWIHGASVGESVLGLAVATRMRTVRPDLVFLHTSGTLTSAGVVAGRLGPRDLHRYAPVDTPAATAGFIDHWRPDLGILIEGELWPNLLEAARGAGVPLALANARMTARSLRGWGRLPRTARHLLAGFRVILPADRATRAGLAGLAGVTLPPAGNLKLSVPVAAPDPAVRASAAAALGQRPVWVAASTHPGEEERLLQVHAAVLAAAPDALLILAPRHPERAGDVEISCHQAGLLPVRRSSGAIPGPGTPVWLWDTMGELPLALALAPVTVMGGSLVPGIGGHNPVEPVSLGSAVISGTQVFNFADLYLQLDSAGGIRLCTDDHQLALAVATLLADPEPRTVMVDAARAVVAEGAGAMDRAVAELVALVGEAGR